jgi:hypothetical protein
MNKNMNRWSGFFLLSLLLGCTEITCTSIAIDNNSNTDIRLNLYSPGVSVGNDIQLFALSNGMCSSSVLNIPPGKMSVILPRGKCADADWNNSVFYDYSKVNSFTVINNGLGQPVESSPMNLTYGATYTITGTPGALQIIQGQ